MVNTKKEVFTTGECAKIMKISQQTVIRCFDNGTLKGFRVPGSRFRRIPRANLITFIKENGLPMDAFGPESSVVLLWGEGAAELMQEFKDRKVEVRSGSGTSWELAMEVKDSTPQVLVIKLDVFDAPTLASVCSNLQSGAAGFTTRIAILVDAAEQVPPELSIDATVELGSEPADEILSLLDET